MFDLRQYIQFVIEESIRSKNKKFDIREFKSINDAKQLFDYVEDRLEYIGSGSSRVAFVYSSTKVLKITNIYSDWPKAGLGQNEQEVNVATDPKIKIIVPKIYDYHPDYLWIISELVKPFNRTDFKSVLNTIGIHSSYDDSDFEWRFTDLIRYSAEGRFKVAKNYFDVPDIELNEERLKEFVEAVFKLVTENGIIKTDIMRPENWGLNLKGQLVLLDAGFSDEVARGFYS